MASLQVRLNGETIASLQLENGKEYIAGRAGDAQIQLLAGKGISRNHLKFYERDGTWVCEALSKFGSLQKGSESHQVLELSESCSFAIPPYEFVFATGAKSEPTAGDQKPGENLPAFYQPRVSASGTPGEHTAPRANNEATVAGGASLVPYFRISYPNTADDIVLRLEGELWVAGRDSSSEIPIDSAHISRKHFELARTKDGYFITDLGSSNGTKVNGQKIPPHEPTRIESGDEIRVMNIEMTFEIRDIQFANRLERLPVPVFDPLLEPASPGLYPPGAQAPLMLPATEYRPPAHELAEITETRWKRQWRDLRRNKVRMALVILAPVLLIMALLPSKQDGAGDKRGPAGAGNSVVFESLNKEQKLVVKDSFNLARTLYVQGKYALCLTELAKLHELIPQYENSKELQSFCEQGLELIKREEEIRRREKEKQEVEERISGYVEQCKQQLGPEASVDETRVCLGPAIELAPEHNLVVEMLSSAQMHEEEKRFMQSQKAAEAAKAAKGRAAFNRATATYKKGQLAQAIREFEKFAATPYPQLADLREQANRQIATIRKELKVKVETQLEQCKQLGAKNKYKEAYKACDRASAEDPDNVTAQNMKASMLKALQRDMKAIYEDSVLEESLGNVDSAKEKWQRILNEDLDFDDYARKARSKLQKYGVPE